MTGVTKLLKVHIKICKHDQKKSIISHKTSVGYDMEYNVIALIILLYYVSGPPTRFWECLDQKNFGCLGEWHKREFPGKHPWQSTISEKMGGLYLCFFFIFIN